MAKPKHTHRPGAPTKAGAQRAATSTRAQTAARTSSAMSTTSTAHTESKRAAERATSAATSAAGTRSVKAAPPSTVRARARAGNSRRRAQQAPWWRRKNLPIYGTVASVVLLIALFVFIARSQTPDIGAQPAPASVAAAVTNVNPSVLSTVGTGGITNQLHPISGAELLKGPSGKPEILYIGAGYCPYCAAERWSMIVALSRFGTFKNLQVTHSSHTDVFPDTPTFTFYGSTYTSQYIDFVAVEETGQDQNTTLQTPTDAQQKILTTYDTSQYVGSSLAGGIPFIDIGNRFVAVSSGYSPQILTGQTWQDVADALKDPSSPMTQSIVGTANYLTAAICTITNNQPAGVCGAAPIPQIEQQLPKG